MPSGRDVHSTKHFLPSTLEAETLEQMRAPPGRSGNVSGYSDSSSDEDGNASESTQLPGAFPSASTMKPTESYY